MDWKLALGLLLAAAAVAGVLYLLVCYVVGWILLRNLTHPVRYSYEHVRKSDEQNGFTECFEEYEKLEKHKLEIVCSDGVKLCGEYIINPSGKKKVAIVCHGQTVNLMAALKYARMLYAQGYSIVMYDHRYFGYSEGKHSTLGYKESADLVVVIKKVREIFGEDCTLCLHGESMGSGTVLMALARPETKGLVDFAIVDCPFASTYRLCMDICVRDYHVNGKLFLKYAARLAKLYGYDIMAAEPIEGARKADIPILFIHGTGDKLIEHSHSVDMAAVCKNQLSRCELFDGAPHAMSCVADRPRYEKLIADFCAECETEL